MIELALVLVTIWYTPVDPAASDFDIGKDEAHGARSRGRSAAAARERDDSSRDEAVSVPINTESVEAQSFPRLLTI